MHDYYTERPAQSIGVISFIVAELAAMPTGNLGIGKDKHVQ